MEKEEELIKELVLLKESEFNVGELVAITDAVVTARKVYEAVLFEKHNLDSAYFKLTMIVDSLDTNFIESLERITFEREPYKDEKDPSK